MAWKNVQYENGKYRTSKGGGGGSSTFAGLDDVSFSNIQNGQVPKYNSTTQKWENANGSGSGHNYSTTEQVVGTWIDGKPLYEKVITGLSINMNWNSQYRTENTFTNAPTDIDTLIHIEGIGVSGGHPSHYAITVYGADSSNWLLFSLEGGTINTLILQYTKTTD